MSSRPSSRNGFPVLLLVDDDPADRRMVERALEETGSDVRFLAVEDGEQALELLETVRPDLVLLDLNMPRVDGWELVRRLRADSRFRRLPVVALTTSRDEHDVRLSYDVGFDAYVVKPTSLADLRHVLETLQEYWFRVVESPPVG